jgi:hypothetical protein
MESKGFFGGKDGFGSCAFILFLILILLFFGNDIC